MRLYYQIYADRLPADATYVEIFNRLWAKGGRFSLVRITSKQIRLLLRDSDDPEKHTEIKLGLSGMSTAHPEFIQVSATTPEKAAEIFHLLIPVDSSEEVE